MESQSNSETIRSPTSPSPSPSPGPTSDHSRFSAPPNSQFGERPPRPQTHSNVFVENQEVQSDQSGELVPLIMLQQTKEKKELLGFGKNLSLKKTMVTERLFAHIVSNTYQPKPQMELSI